MKRKFNYYSKKIHRYLGIFIGIQFLLWTVGGLYFSWTNIEEIRGEHLRNESNDLTVSETLVSPNVAINEFEKANEVSEIKKVQLVEVLDKPFYEIVLLDKKGKLQTFLADAENGNIREDISKDEAVEIATNALVNKSSVKEVKVLTQENVGGHHEYREKPLPAFAVTFEKPSDLTVYVAQKTGKVESFRTNEWRVFDFFWMLHTMDFFGRDNINNYVLRIFSLLGVLMLVSGYILFFVTSPWFRRRNTTK